MLNNHIVIAVNAFEGCIFAITIYKIFNERSESSFFFCLKQLNILPLTSKITVNRLLFTCIPLMFPIYCAPISPQLPVNSPPWSPPTPRWTKPGWFKFRWQYGFIVVTWAGNHPSSECCLYCSLYFFSMVQYTTVKLLKTQLSHLNLLVVFWDTDTDTLRCDITPPPVACRTGKHPNAVGNWVIKKMNSDIFMLQ